MIGFKSKGVGGMQFSGGRSGGTAVGYVDSNSISGGRGYNEMGMGYMDSIRRNETLMSREVAGDFDDIAVSETFLDEYYSQVIYTYWIM